MLMRRRALLAALALAGVHAAVADPMVDYTLFCMGCHGAQARGVPGKVPPLAGALSRFMRTPQGRDYVLRVPGAANSALSDAQLTAVLNWLAERDAGAGAAPVAPFTVAEVTAARRTPLASVQETRRAVISALAAGGGAAPALDY
ncbi:MAG: c-type cytochrome [Steroidobacterales bacterium]|jgi:cytochrome c553